MNTDISHPQNAAEARLTIPELLAIFGRLGATAFGGPLAHIALMEQEFVTRRGWFSRQEFLDMVGATNLVPGPNSTEMAMHIGHRRGGVAGLIAAGVAFILPAALLMLALAWFYSRYGTVPQLQSPLRGVSAVVVAIIAHALWKFSQTALKKTFAFIVAVTCVVAMFFLHNELIVLFAAALVGLICGASQKRVSKDKDGEADGHSKTPAFFLAGGALASTPAMLPTLGSLFLIFLKIGSVLYGSGYVLISFLRQDLVERTGWLTDKQLLDAVAFGQFTPGPLFTTATFIGYLLGGVGGATVATVGIFLPSFFFVGLLSYVLRSWKDSPLLRSFLDAVNAASLALMAVVTFQLGQSSLNTVPTFLLATVALALLMKTKVNSAWWLIAGGLIGAIIKL